MGKKKTASERKCNKKVKVHTQPTEDLVQEDMQILPKQIYLPGMPLPATEGEEGQWELEADMSAYVLLRSWQSEWPCLSFDVLRDEGGEERTAFPMSALLVAGSQAPSGSASELMVMRLSNLHKNGKAKDSANDDEDEDESSDDDDDEDEEGEKRPRFCMASIEHPGCVNRVRTHSWHPSVLTATWSDSGALHVWSLQEAKQLVENGSAGMHKVRTRPLHSLQGGAEGYALDWLSSGTRLVAGDCSGRIAQLEVTVDGRVSVLGEPFLGHSGSVEDLQWSPLEQTAFASCGTDGTVRLWDTRMPSPAITQQASQTDVNVISWCPRAAHMLASGHDDGQFATWDLRAIQTPVFSSSWHSDAVTSIEWNPVDGSVLAVSGADDQTTLWDFAIESTLDEAEIEGREIPPQLLFIHQGQQHVKEVHWHPQLSGVLLTTAASGFNILKTISV